MQILLPIRKSLLHNFRKDLHVFWLKKGDCFYQLHSSSLQIGITTKL